MAKTPKAWSNDLGKVNSELKNVNKEIKNVNSGIDSITQSVSKMSDAGNVMSGISDNLDDINNGIMTFASRFNIVGYDKMSDLEKLKADIDKYKKILLELPDSGDLGNITESSGESVTTLRTQISSIASMIDKGLPIDDIRSAFTNVYHKIENIIQEESELIHKLIKTGSYEDSDDKPGILKSKLNGFLSTWFYPDGTTKLAESSSKQELSNVAEQVKRIKDEIQSGTADITQFGMNESYKTRLFGFEYGGESIIKSKLDNEEREINDEIGIVKRSINELKSLREIEKTMLKSDKRNYKAVEPSDADLDSAIGNVAMIANSSDSDSFIQSKIESYNEYMKTLETSGKKVKGYLDLIDKAYKAEKLINTYEPLMNKNNTESLLRTLGGSIEQESEQDINSNADSLLKELQKKKDAISNEVKELMDEKSFDEAADKLVTNFNEFRAKIADIASDKIVKQEQTKLRDPHSTNNFNRIIDNMQYAKKELADLELEIDSAQKNINSGKLTNLNDIARPEISRGVLRSPYIINMSDFQQKEVEQIGLMYDKLKDKISSLLNEQSKLSDSTLKIAPMANYIEAANRKSESYSHKDSLEKNYASRSQLSNYYKEKLDIIKSTYDKEIELADGNAKKIAEVKEKYIKKEVKTEKQDRSGKLVSKTIEIDGKLTTASKDYADINAKTYAIVRSLNEINIKEESLKSNDYTDAQIEDLGILARELDNVRSKLESYNNEKSNKEIFNNATTKIESISGADSNVKYSIYKEALQNMKQDGSTYNKTLKLLANEESIINNSKLRDIRSFISEKEALESRQFTAKEKYDYYDSQLVSFKKGTPEYMQLLKMRFEAQKQMESKTNTSSKQSNNILTIAQQVAKGVNNAINGIIGMIRKVGQVIRTVIQTSINIMNGLKNTVARIIDIFGSLSNRVKQLFGFTENSGKQFNILAGTATELRSKLLILKGAFDTLFNSQYINDAKKLYSSVYSLNVIIGKDLTQATIDWAYQLEKAYGLSATNIIQDLQEITAVMYGLGMTGDDVSIASKNLLMMSRYLGYLGLAGGDSEEVMSKLTSGMKGMTQSIDDLGLSVRETQMQSFLDDLAAKGDIAETSWTSLNEEARVYVRYASLIAQFTSRYDLTKFAESLDTVSGRTNILKERFNSLLTTIGQVFLRIFAQLSGFLVVGVSFVETYIRKLADSVNNLFDWLDMDINVFAGMNGLTDGVSGNLNDMANSLDDSAKSTETIKGNLSSVDRLDSISSSGSADSGNDTIKFASLMASALDGLEKKMSEMTDSYMERLKESAAIKLQDIGNRIQAWLSKLSGRKNLNFGFDFSKIKSNLSSTFEDIKIISANISNEIISIFTKIADDMNIGNIITKVTTLIVKIAEMIKVFTEEAFPVIDKFYDEHLKPIFEKLGLTTDGVLDKLIGKVEKLTEYFKSDKFETDFADGLVTALEKISTVITTIIGTVKLLLVELGLIKSSDSTEAFKDKKPVLAGIVEAIANILAVLKSLWDNVLKELLTKLKDFVGSDILPWINDKLEKLKKYLDENGDAIQELFSVIGSFAWDTFKVFVDALAKIIDFSVENPQKLLNILKAIAVLKIGSWALGGIANAIPVVEKVVKYAPKILGGASTATGSLAGSGLIGGLASLGSTLGSGAATGGGLALAGAGSIAGGVMGGVGVISGIVDIVHGFKETDTKEKKTDIASGASKIGMVGAGAATGAAIGALFAGVGAAPGALIGAGIGGVGALLSGRSVGEAISDATDEGGWMWKIGQFFSKTIPEALEKFFTEKVPAFFEGVKEKIGTFIENVKEKIGTLIENIKESVTTFFTETVPNKFKELLTNIGDIFTEKIPYAIGFIAAKLETFFTETVPNFIGGLITDIKDIFTTKIPEAIGFIATKLETFFTETVPNFIGELITGMKDIFTTKIPEAVATISSNIAEFITVTLPEKIGEIFENINTFFSDTIPDLASDIWDGIKEFFYDIPDMISGVWDKVKSWFSAGYEDGKASSTTSTGTSSTAKKSTDAAIADINKQFSGIGNSTMLSYKGYASGGIPEKGSMYMANENGNTELVGNFGGYTGVASNNTILTAMKEAISESMYNAMAQLVNKINAPSNNTKSGLELNFNGVMINDENSLRTLMDLCMPYIVKYLKDNNYVIA